MPSFMPYRYRRMVSWCEMRSDFGFEARDMDGGYCLDAIRTIPQGSTVSDEEEFDFVYRP